jgi:hypothetical protein
MCFFFFLIEFPRPFAASSNSLANFKDIPFQNAYVKIHHQRTAMFVDLNLFNKVGTWYVAPTRLLLIEHEDLYYNCFSKIKIGF